MLLFEKTSQWLVRNSVSLCFGGYKDELYNNGATLSGKTLRRCPFNAVCAKELYRFNSKADYVTFSSCDVESVFQIHRRVFPPWKQFSSSEKTVAYFILSQRFTGSHVGSLSHKLYGGPLVPTVPRCPAMAAGCVSAPWRAPQSAGCSACCHCDIITLSPLPLLSLLHLPDAEFVLFNRSPFLTQ